MKNMTEKEYSEFLESLVIEELIKEFNFNCKLNFVERITYGGSKLYTYIFEDENGIKWERDVSFRSYFGIACRSDKMRPRIVE